jgi:hypothetical protein
MHPPETFGHPAAVHDYADRHGLAYLWEGTAAFENRRRTLAPEQYQILAVHTPKGMTRVILFSKDILKAEWKTDAPRHDAMNTIVRAHQHAAGAKKGGAKMRRSGVRVAA